MGGNGVVDIAFTARRTKAREEFIRQWTTFRQKSWTLVGDVMLTEDAFSGPTGRWLSLMQVHLFRAHNWSKEVLELFEKSPYAKDVPEPEKPDCKPIELTPAGVTETKKRLLEMLAIVSQPVDWSFANEEFEVVWTKKRMDQVWVAVKEAVQWIDQAVETVHFQNK